MKSAIEQLAEDSNVNAEFRRIIAGEPESVGNKSRYITWCADQDAATIASLRAKLDTIFAAYAKTNAGVPTPLMCAIEAARKA